MDVVMSATELAAWKHRTDNPTKTQVNSVTQNCRDGTIRHCQKVMNEWQINCTREWPEAFPPRAERVEYDPRRVVADFLVEVGIWLRESANEEG